MSRRFGLGDSTWQRWELEGRLPSHRVLEALKELGLDLNWLTAGEGQSPPIEGTYIGRFVEAHGGAVLGFAPPEQAETGFSGEPYQHQPGPPAPVEPPPPPAAAIVADDLLVELFHRVAALYLSERLPTSAESELRNAIALYNELVEKHGPQGPPADAITARLKAFRDYLRREREAILRGGRDT